MLKSNDYPLPQTPVCNTVSDIYYTSVSEQIKHVFLIRDQQIRSITDLFKANYFTETLLLKKKNINYVFNFLDVNYCNKYDPCENGGLCLPDSEKNFTCKCTPDFTGVYCESVLCFDGYCQNGGNCSVSLKQFICIVTRYHFIYT